MSVCASIVIKNSTREVYLSNYTDGYPSNRGQQLLSFVSNLYNSLEEGDYLSIERIAFQLMSSSRQFKAENGPVPRAEYLYIINIDTKKLACFAIPAYEDYDIDTLTNCALEWSVDI